MASKTAWFATGVRLSPASRPWLWIGAVLLLTLWKLSDRPASPPPQPPPRPAFQTGRIYAPGLHAVRAYQAVQESFFLDALGELKASNLEAPKETRAVKLNHSWFQQTKSLGEWMSCGICFHISDLIRSSDTLKLFWQKSLSSSQVAHVIW